MAWCGDVSYLGAHHVEVSILLKLELDRLLAERLAERQLHLHQPAAFSSMHVYDLSSKHRKLRVLSLIRRHFLIKI